MSTTIYDIGDTPIVKATFKVDGIETDPGEVTLKVQDPDGDVQTYTLSGATIVRTGEGVYEKSLSASKPGKWHYRWVGTDPAAGAEEGWFRVRQSFIQE